MGLIRVRFLMWVFFLASVLLLAPFPVFCALDDGLRIKEGPINIQADRLVYEEDDETYHAEGDVLITYPGGTLRADSVILRKAVNTAYAKGRVVLKSDQDVLEGESVIFNIETKTGTVDEGKMFVAKNHVYVRGSEFEKSGDATYRIQNAVATTCDGPDPAWSLKGQELNVTIDGYGTLKNGTFYAGKVPVFYFPYLLFPVKTTRQSGLLLPYLSYSKDKNGADIELPLYWAISENMDATFYQRFMSKRGFKEGAEFRYFLTPETSGVVYGDYLLRDRLRIREQIKAPNEALSRDWDQDHDRWSFYLQHESAFDNGYYLRADIARVSDHWYFKDFSSRNYYREHYAKDKDDRFKKVSFDADKSLRSLDSKFRFVKDWSLYNLTALARYTDDFTSSSNEYTLQQYPEVTLTAVNQPLWSTPLRFELVTSYNNYYRDKGQKGSLFDFQPVLSLPLSLGPYAQFTPKFEWNGALWSARGEDVAGIDKNGNRSTYSAGGIVTSEIQRIYQVNSKSVQKIRHGIRTEVGYTYSPNVKQNDIPDYARSHLLKLDNRPNIKPEDMPDYLARLGELDEQNGVTYALINTLMVKMNDGIEGPRYRELMRLKLSQTYDIDGKVPYWDDDNNAKDRHFGTVDMELDVTPLPYLSLKSRSRYDVNDGSWLRTNNDLTVTTPRGDEASLGYHYTRGLIEEINVSLKAKINKDIEVSLTLKENVMASRTVEQTYAVTYQRQCWGFKVGYSDSADDQQIFASLSLLGFGF
jgi:LPS-assembly protein